MNLNIQDTFNKELPADPKKDNTRRQVFNACFSGVLPKKPSNPKLIHFSQEMVESIGLSSEAPHSQDFLGLFSGTTIPEEMQPYAMCYGGHQFGHWAGQLGDGRAINLAEVVHQDQRWALQLKGAGETPYSRTADGLAVLRSSIREHLCSEAMYHLGVPTTRSLSLMLTGDQVLRDIMYNGNAAYEKGAVICRVAPSFIRFGNFQIFASRSDTKTLKQLADYTIQHFFPEIKSANKEKYLDFFRTVAELTVQMIVHWQRVGFVHGVMNTDNMSILGLTIDYGPYGWLEGYDPNWTPNTTDRQHRRYRFGQQPGVALWNLLQLANALYPLVEETAPFEEILSENQSAYLEQYVGMMRKKLGLQTALEEDLKLIKDLTDSLQTTEVDMSLFFRTLADLEKGITIDDNQQFLKPVLSAFYNPNELEGEVLDGWKNWFTLYIARLNQEDTPDEDRRIQMNTINPKYVLRNYMAQLAIEDADKGNYGLIDELHQILKHPYDEQPEYEKWFAKRPEWARHKVGCSMLSCSS